jgi:hypothetical protein
MVPSSFSYPEVPLFEVLRGRDTGRFIGSRGVLVPNLACVVGFDDVRAHDPTTWARYDRWLAEVLDLRRGGQIAQYVKVKRAHRAALDALATRYLLARDGLRVPPPWKDRGVFGYLRLWELDREPRWAFFPREVVAAASADEAFRLTRGDRPAESLVPIEAPSLAEGLSTHRATDPATGPREQPPGTVRILGVERQGTRIRIRVNTLREAWLVVSQAAIPGWRATVDGRRTPIAIADGVLIAVRIPPGGRLVDLRYRPLGWRIGWPISLLTAIALLGGLITRRRRRAQESPSPSPTETSR